METVTISPKYQVVIPKAIRERLKLRAGQKVRAIAYDDRIELVPVRPVKALRGAMPGLDTTVERDPDRLVNVVDSSGWLEYLAGGPNAEFFAPAIESSRMLVVPTLSLYEVFKRVLGQRDENSALQAVAAMQHGRIVELSTSLALSAAHLSVNLNLPMADSVMLATARAYEATLWTQDADFKDVPGVQYVARRRP